MVAITPSPFAQIGEVKATLAVKDQVVGRRQFVPTALAIEHPRLAGARIDPLDVAALVISGGPGREEPALRVFIAAIVADVKRAVGADRETVWSAARTGDRLLLSIGFDARDFAGGDLDDKHRAVRHRHRPFRESQPGRDLANVHLIYLHHGHSCQRRKA